MIKIGTWDHPLAQWHANYALYSLQEKGIAATLVDVLPRPEALATLDLGQKKQEFRQAVEAALLCGDVDLAVHALDDLPTQPTEGLTLAGVSFRDLPNDCLLFRQGEQVDGQLFKLRQGAVIGTATVLRKAQLFGYRPDLSFVEVMEDLPKVIEQLHDKEFDAALVAAADMSRLRLELEGVERLLLNAREFVPRPGQGVLAYQCCTADLETRRHVQRLLHQPTVSAVTNVERRVLRLLGGDPTTAVGAYCERDNLGNYHVWAAFVEAWDQPVRRVRRSQSTSFELAELVVG